MHADQTRLAAADCIAPTPAVICGVPAFATVVNNGEKPLAQLPQPRRTPLSRMNEESAEALAAWPAPQRTAVTAPRELAPHVACAPFACR